MAKVLENQTLYQLGEDHMQIPDFECCADCGMSEMDIEKRKKGK